MFYLVGDRYFRISLFTLQSSLCIHHCWAQKDSVNQLNVDLQFLVHGEEYAVVNSGESVIKTVDAVIYSINVIFIL